MAKRLLRAVLLCAGLAPSLAFAQTSKDEVRAEELFAEAVRLAEADRYAEACPKLEESQLLDPGLGTQFNLGACYEHTGRFAAAWREFTHVARGAHAAGKAEREQAARERAAALEPRIARLVLKIDARAQGLVVKVDGIPVVEGDSRPVAADPGEHEVEATAPGRRGWKTRVSAEAGSTLHVAIPELDAAPPQAGPHGAGLTAREDESDAKVTTRWNALHYVGVVTAGVGVLGLGAGAVSALQASSKQSEAGCPNNECADEVQASVLRDAKSAADRATVFFVAGGLLVGAGAALWLVAPYERVAARPVGLAPLVLTGGGGFTLRGTF